MTSRYTVRKNSGRSGKSVYQWRVYHEFDANGTGYWKRTQLAKCRPEQAANDAADFYRRNAIKIAA